MKTKTSIFFVCLLATSLAISLQSMAQQAMHTKPASPAPQQASNPFAINYSFQIYSAPGNGYGYDIFKDGKPVFRQFVLAFMTNDGKRVLLSKQNAQKAATLAIEKIKKGTTPSLTEAEIKNIAAQ
jgi:hypothetical protein